MARRDSFLTARRLLIGLIVFGLFVVFDIALFGYLIFDTLSQRELEKVFLETREDAAPVVRELEKQAEIHGQDLWVVMSVQVTQRYMASMLREHEIVRKVEVRDAQGVVVSQVSTESVPVGGEEPEDVPQVAPGDSLELNPESAAGLEELEIPIGDLGTLVLGLSREQLQRRVAVLRRDLIRRASLIGLVTVTLLLAAIAAIWWLLRRGRQLEEQALEAERMAYIGTLASGLAHEIRNPLNALNLNMQMLDEEAQGGALGGSAGRLLAITQAEISRLERLVTDFLSYARPRALELEEVPAAELLEDVRSVLDSEIRARGAEVLVEDKSDGARVKVDRGQMRQLLLNLTQNALQATERLDRRPRVLLIARRQGSSVVLEVKDNGAGMSQETKDRMFDIFFSTRKGGTGLGLAIVERIARNHDGKLEVDSSPGQGTTVRLILPRVGARQSITQTIPLPVLDG
ncbi:MAG: GHKL domain-containing protein [Acidobacteria bacterium]|nr:MAG: GHKL domain-containing protein [Acidobacteriota bacterium]